MKKFDIDKIMKNLSEKDARKINQTYNNKTNKEENFKKWFFDTFILIVFYLKDYLFHLLLFSFV